MKNHSILLGICALGLLFSCAVNPLTGKKTLNLVSNEQLFPTSFQQYGTFYRKTRLLLELQMQEE
jgi:hypothetical protein